MYPNLYIFVIVLFSLHDNIYTFLTSMGIFLSDIHLITEQILQENREIFSNWFTFFGL